MDLSALKSAISGRAAALRSVSRLHPAAKDDGLIFPPTFANAVYSTGKRLVMRDGGEREEVDCVLLDSVQSQANRMERALEESWVDGRLALPVIEVDFSEANENEFLAPVYGVNSLSVPHRLADAILRDSQTVEGVAFSKSDCAKAWGKSTLQDATAIYRYCPTALVFGMWGSPKKPGGLGERFARALVSEIVGVNSHPFDAKRGLRRDPANIAKEIGVVETDGGWDVASEKAKKAQRPSEVNHSNVPFDSPNGGVTVEYAEQSAVISLPQLRRLRFPIDGKHDIEVDRAGRTVLAALGLTAAALAGESGLDLRSGCLLFPESAQTWELLSKPGEKPIEFELDGESAISLLNEAVSEAEAIGLEWMKDTMILRPQKKLVELIKASQEHQATAKSDD